MAKKNKDNAQLNRTLSFNMTARSNLQGNASNQTLAQGEHMSATMTSNSGALSKVLPQSTGQVPQRSGFLGLPPTASQRSGLRLRGSASSARRPAGSAASQSQLTLRTQPSHQRQQQHTARPANPNISQAHGPEGTASLREMRSAGRPANDPTG